MHKNAAQAGDAARREQVQSYRTWLKERGVLWDEKAVHIEHSETMGWGVKAAAAATVEQGAAAQWGWWTWMCSDAPPMCHVVCVGCLAPPDGSPACAPVLRPIAKICW